jgi:hypothetical protein
MQLLPWQSRAARRVVPANVCDRTERTACPDPCRFCHIDSSSAARAPRYRKCCRAPASPDHRRVAAGDVPTRCRKACDFCARNLQGIAVTKNEGFQKSYRNKRSQGNSVCFEEKKQRPNCHHPSIAVSRRYCAAQRCIRKRRKVYI